MRVRIPGATNSQRCPRCNKMMRTEWFGFRCPQCQYEQLNNEGREFVEHMNMKETVE